MIEDGDKEPPDESSGGDAALLEPVETPVPPSAPAPVETSVTPAIEPTAEPAPTASDPPAPAAPSEPSEPTAPVEPKSEEPSELTEPPAVETAMVAEASDQPEPAVAIEAVLPDAVPPMVVVLTAEPAPTSEVSPPAPAEPAPLPVATPEPAKPVPTPEAPVVPAVVLPGRLGEFVEFAAWRLVESLATLAVAALAIYLLLPTSTTPDWSGLGERLTVTLPLLALSLLLAGVIGWAVGEAAVRLGGAAGAGLAALAGVGTSLSPLVLGLVLLLVVAGMLGWLPPGGFVPWEQNAVGALQSLLLPALSLALPAGLALAAALWRAARPFSTPATFTAATERGLGRSAALSRLVLPQAWAEVWPSVVVTLALLPPIALVIEAAFYLPGLSRLLFGAISSRDIAGLQLALLALAALVVFCRWLGDLVRGASNPLLTDRR